MTLAEIFEQLTFGELSYLSMGGAEGGTIRPEDYQRVIAHVNMGLKNLYGRFWLASRDVIIEVYDHIQVYELERRFARTNTLSPEPYRYIMDSVYEPFQNDVLKIEEVFDEGGRKHFLNDLTEPWSLFTPSYNKIQIPFPYKDNSMLVHYRASHPSIKYQPGMNPEDIIVDLPESLFEALLLFIGSRATGNLNSDQNQETMTLMQKYEAACVRAEAMGLYITPEYSNRRLDENGWP